MDSFFDAFDDDETGPLQTRKLRPEIVNLHALQQWVFESDADSISAAKAVWAAHESVGTPWHALVGQTVELAEKLCSAELVDVVLNSAVAQALFAEGDMVHPSEVGSLAGVFRARGAAFASRGVPVVEGQEDTFIDDDDITPLHYNTLQIVLLASACVQLFIQTNWTGPELESSHEHAVAALPVFLPWIRAHAAAFEAPPVAVVEFTPQGSTEVGIGAVAPGAADSGAAATTAAKPAPEPKVDPREMASQAWQAACVTGLAVDGMDAYDLLSSPSTLVVARGLLAAVGPLSEGLRGLAPAVRAPLAAQVSFHAPDGDLGMHPLALPAPSGVARDMVAAAQGLVSTHWWRLRAASAHQQSLVAGTPSSTLFVSALVGAKRSAALLGMSSAQAAALVDGDVWNKELVAGVLASTTTRDADGVSGSDAVAATALEGMSEGLSSLAPETAYRSRRLWSRLLLEWGLMQVHCDRMGGAKTSFLVAKGVSGLWTHLTGALGRRTKYQQFDVSQLVLRAASLPPPQGLEALDKAVSAPATGAGDVGGAAAGPETLAPQATDGEDAPSGAGEGSAWEAPVDEEDGDGMGAAAAVAARERIREAGTVNALGIADVQLDGLEEDNIILEKVDLAEDRADPGEGNVDGEGQRVFPPWYEGKWAQAHSIAATPDGPTVSAATDGFLASTGDGDVTTLDQAIVCALCLDIKNNNPDDGLTQEEMRSYTARVLASPQNWMVYSTALLTKSWLEYTSHRTMERSLLQMQVLVDQYTNRLTPTQFSQRVIDESAPAWDRLRYMHALVFPPRWALKRQLAERYKAMHVIRSALGLFEELELWDDVIDCWIMLEKPARAKKLLDKRLAIAPSPRLLCRLGQVTSTDEPYIRAWELSRHTYAAAQLSLARRYYNRDEWDAAATALELGTALSRHNDVDFMLLGTVNMRREALPKAVAAFKRVVALTPDHGGAWGNMGGCLVHMGRHREAYEALVQASKWRRQEWKVWHNLIRVSLVTRAYFKAIAGMKHMANLVDKDANRGNKGVDTELLKYLVAVISEDIRARDAAPAPPPPPVEREEAPPGESEVPERGDAGVVLPELPTGMEEDEEAGEDGDAILRSLGSDGMLRARLSTSAAAQVADADLPATARDMLGNRAYLYAGSLFRLLQHLTATLPNNAELWHVLEMFERARGRDIEALDALQKHVRALMTGSWDREEARVEAVAKASERLVAALIVSGVPTNLTAAVSHVRNLVARLEARLVFHTLPSIVALTEQVAATEAALQEAVGEGAATEPGAAAEG